MVVYVALFVGLVVSALSTLYVHIADVLVSLALVGFPSTFLGETIFQRREFLGIVPRNRTGTSDQGESLVSSAQTQARCTSQQCQLPGSSPSSRPSRLEIQLATPPLLP